MTEELVEAYLLGNLAGRREMMTLIDARMPGFAKTISQGIGELINAQLIAMMTLIDARMPGFAKTISQGIGELINAQLIAVHGSLQDLASRHAEIDISKAPSTLQADMKRAIAIMIEEKDMAWRRSKKRKPTKNPTKQSRRKK